MGFRGRHNDFLFLVSPLAVIYIPVIIDWEHAGHATLNTLRTRAVNESSQSLTVETPAILIEVFSRKCKAKAR